MEFGSSTMFTREELTAALMMELGEPKKFMAAHWLLSGLYFDLLRKERDVAREPGDKLRRFEQRADGSFAYWLDGLDVQLKLMKLPEQYWTAGGEELMIWRCSATTSDAQVELVREQWQRRLSHH